MDTVFDITSVVNGEQRHEKVLIEWRDGDDLLSMLHQLGLKLAMSPEGQKKYIGTGLSYSEFFNRLNDEMLAPYHMSIRWLDREAVCIEDYPLISHFEMESHLELMKDIDTFIRRTREVSVQYIRRLARLHTKEHPLVSTWDDVQMFDRALSWAEQYVRSESDKLLSSRFYETKLADAIQRAGISSECAAWRAEQNIPQSADGKNNQNIPQSADGSNEPIPQPA